MHKQLSIQESVGVSRVTSQVHKAIAEHFETWHALASAIDAAAMAQVQATLCQRVLRASVARGLLESCAAKDMLAKQRSGIATANAPASQRRRAGSQFSAQSCGDSHGGTSATGHGVDRRLDRTARHG